MPRPSFRFAPSPNGYLHLGHAYSALLNARLAQASGGAFLLRIEDIDVGRCRPEFETAIYEDLAWLGLKWELPVRRQSQHRDTYADALAKLEGMGLIYPAFETRGDIARRIAAIEAGGRAWPRDPDGAPLYPGSAHELPDSERTRRRASGEPYALRLAMAAAMAQAGSLSWEEDGSGPAGKSGTVIAEPSAWGDVVLARKDVPTSYHLSVVVDDALQNITHVVRGSDLFHATSVHRLLQSLLGLPEPRYRHHRLVVDDEGRKLSKSTQATGLRELRAAGITPAQIEQQLGLPRG